QLELLPNQLAYVLLARDYIPAQDRSWFIVDTKRITKCIKDLAAKERNLPFVAVLVIEETVTANPMSSYAFDQLYFDDGVNTWRLTMVTEVVVAAGNVEVRDFHPIEYHAAVGCAKISLEDDLRVPGICYKGNGFARARYFRHRNRQHSQI